MQHKASIPMAICLVLACACTGNSTPQEGEKAPADSDETAGVYQRPVQKARQVEDQLQRAADKHEQALKQDEEGGG